MFLVWKKVRILACCGVCHGINSHILACCLVAHCCCFRCCFCSCCLSRYLGMCCLPFSDPAQLAVYRLPATRCTIQGRCLQPAAAAVAAVAEADIVAQQPSKVRPRMRRLL